MESSGGSSRRKWASEGASTCSLLVVIVHDWLIKKLLALCTSSTPQTIVGLILIYQFRQFERQVRGSSFFLVDVGFCDHEGDKSFTLLLFLS